MTRDVDMTYKSTIYQKEEIETVINNIIYGDYPSLFNYSISNIEQSQENDEHPGFVFTLMARLNGTNFS